MALVRIFLFTAILSVALIGRAFAQAPACKSLFAPAETLTGAARALQITPNEVARFESEIEAFLLSEKIEFRKIASNQPLNGVIGHGYLLTGRRDGGATSRLIYGVQRRDAPHILLDSLYAQKEKSVAHYTVKDHVITVGIEALEARASGRADFLRHEIQHHFEQIKIEKGEFSLARVIYANEKASESASYDWRLSFDELEAYLRDFRKFRQSEVRDQLQMLIAKERAILERLRARLAAPSAEESNQMWLSTFGKDQTPANGIYRFQIGESESVVVRVSFSRTLPKRPALNQLKFLMEQTIEDAEFRILEIEREISRP